MEQSILNEYGVIGSLLVDPTLFPEASGLSEDDFTLVPLCEVFRAMRRQYGESGSFDALTIRTEAGQHCSEVTDTLNTTRVSNFFIEIRVVSYLESLAIQGFPFFCVWLMCIGKHQNCEDVFIRRHRYMNTAFRYSYFDMLLQTLAVSCISAFDGGEPHYKNGYTHPRSSENAVQKCIHVGRSPLF